jgi:hypothetical protein
VDEVIAAMTASKENSSGEPESIFSHGSVSSMDVDWINLKIDYVLIDRNEES